MGEPQVAPQPVFALLLPGPLYQYLQQVFEGHVRQGIPSDELEIATEFNRRLLGAQPVDFSKLGHATVTKAAPGSVGVDLAPSPDAPLDPF